MNGRLKVIALALLVCGGLWLAIGTFLGGTDDYASRLNFHSAARLESQPRAESDKSAPTNAPSVPSRESARPAGSLSSRTSAEAGTGELAGDASRGDGDVRERAAEMGAGMPVADASGAEVALLERIDPELLRRRAPTRALDLSLVGCTVGSEAAAGTPPPARPDVTVGVLFRHGSVAIKGASLSTIDTVIGAFRECDTGLLVVERNPEGLVDIDDDERVATRREEELKYYLLQRRVPRELMRFPNTSRDRS